jgi:dephospho-CoA kinase
MSDYVIGLTGGIASGKSAVSQRFEALGIVVADADAAAREAVAVGSDGLADVVDMFGTGVLAADGSLDRPAMRRRVFADPDARKRLEGIIHPHVRELLHATCARAGSPYAIAAVPLLAEGGGRRAYPWLQRILVVDVPEAVQLQRLLQRDGIDELLARRMIEVQATRRRRLAIADDVLANDGPLDALDERVAALDRLYRNLAATSL